MNTRNLPATAATAVVAISLSMPSARAEHPILPDTFPDFHFVNALVINDPDNPLFGFHHFYVNDQGLEAFRKGEPYPTGSVFLGLVYKVSSEGGLLNEGDGVSYTTMTKDPLAADTGGWQFAQFKPDGTLIQQDVKSACFQCHTQVEDQDYVFSTPLDLPLPGK